MADTEIWLNLSLSATLVLISGAFAGLTIALMTQDELYLQVVALSGEAADRKNAQEIIALLKKGKHWVLVTLLLANCIASEALPIILDRTVDGGLSAVVGSSILVVIFSEIIPQSICARHSLRIGSFMVPFVSAFMYMLAPIAWSIGKSLDVLVGDSHATGFKRRELNTLFSLHGRLGKPNDRLISEEVQMVHGTLGLVDKMVTSIMTPINDVFSISADAIMSPHATEHVKSQGYSRILIHAPNDPKDIIGILSAKKLLKYNPKTCRRVYDLDWSPIPVINARTTCLNLLKIFQERKYDIFLVGRRERNKALGIVTRTDIIEAITGRNTLKSSISGKETDAGDQQKSPTQKSHHVLCPPVIFPSTFLEKPQTIAVSVPEGELLPLWAKSSFPSNYGSFNGFHIRNYLSATPTCHEIELGSTYGRR